MYDARAVSRSVARVMLFLFHWMNDIVVASTPFGYQVIYVVITVI